MNYPHKQLVALLGEGYEKIFFSFQRQAYADRCSQLFNSAELFGSSLEEVQQIEDIKQRIDYINGFVGDGDYSQILRECLSRGGWTLEVALGERFRDLKVASKRLSRELELAKELVASEMADFGFVESECMNSLKEYIRIAESIRETEEIKVLEKEMRDLAHVSRGDTFSPFVLLCASSGTGKTNMALSLNSPFLYVLYDLDNDQSVYKCFREQSRQLKGLFIQDLKKYAADLAADLDSYRFLPFKSVGFLVEFIYKIKNIYDSAPLKTNAALLQVSIRNISFKAMTVDEGRLALQELFNSESYYIPIIIDECALSSDCSPEEVDQFTFMRSILSCLLCMPIFIGTNAQAVNFRGCSRHYCSGDIVDPSCWCLVWHHPAGVPKNLMNETFSKIRDLVLLYRQRKKSAIPSDKLLVFLKKYFAKERPLFGTFAERYFEFFCSNENSHCESDEEFLAMLVEDILEQFMCSKEVSIPWMNSGQLAYMATISTQRTYRASVFEYKYYKEWVESRFDSDWYMHNHLGYLSATSDDRKFRKYTKFGETVCEYEYQLMYLKGPHYEYDISTCFESFNSAPLTGLMMAGVTADNQLILCEKELMDENLESDPRKRNALGLKRISLLAAIKESIMHLKSSVAEYSPTTSGFRLELALFTSTVLASRGEGFKGCRFDLFLAHLAREIDFAGKFGNGVKPPAIVFHKDFPRSILRKRIPFLPSMGVKEWDKVLASQLQELFGAYLGIADVSVTKEGSEMIVTNYPNGLIVFAGAMNTAPVDVEYLEKFVLKTGWKYPTCNLFLAAAPSFTNLHSFYQKRTFLWEFEQNGNELHLVPAKTNIGQYLRATKHIITLDMHILSRANPKKIDELIAEFQTENNIQATGKHLKKDLLRLIFRIIKSKTDRKFNCVLQYSKVLYQEQHCSHGQGRTCAKPTSKASNAT